MRNCVNNVWRRFEDSHKPNLILPMKCCDSFSSFDAHDQVLKGAPVRDFTTIVGESGFSPTVKPLRSQPPLLFPGGGQARHASKSGSEREFNLYALACLRGRTSSNM